MNDDASRPAADEALAVVIAAEGWHRAVPGAADLAREAARAALTTAGVSVPVELTVRLTDDAEVRALNRAWRRRDRATNVLSFPAAEHRPGTLVAPPAPGLPVILGDIAIALETVLGEAAAAGLDPADHARHLVVHGVLHLLGYDHENDREAAVMEALEARALATLAIPDPYARAAS